MEDSEILSIKHSCESQIIAPGKFSDDAFKVAAIVAMEQGRDVLKDQLSWLKLVDDRQGVEKEPGLRAFQSAFAADATRAHRDVRAWAAEGDAVDVRELPALGRAHIRELDGTGKSVSKHSPVSFVELNLPGRWPTCAFKAKIEAADSGEEAADGALRGRLPPAGFKVPCVNQPARLCVLSPL